ILRDLGETHKAYEVLQEVPAVSQREEKTKDIRSREILEPNAVQRRRRRKRIVDVSEEQSSASKRKRVKRRVTETPTQLTEESVTLMCEMAELLLSEGNYEPFIENI